MSTSGHVAAEDLTRVSPSREVAYCTLHAGPTASSGFTRSLAELSEGLFIDVVQPDGSRDVYRIGAPQADGAGFVFRAERVERP